MVAHVIDITGQRFGRLVVACFFERRKTGKVNRRYFLCKCDCGSEYIALGDRLKEGRIRSCGCLRIELIKRRSVTHGLTRSRAFRTWQSMKTRVFNPKTKYYKDYGGRGIGIDDPNWLVFANFFAEMGDPPPGMSLDRINNDLGYSKANCRWATPLQQRHNRRR